MKLKTLLIFILLFTFYNIANGQSPQKTSSIGKLGITVSSLSSNDIIYFGDIAGSAGYDGESFFSVGFIYFHHSPCVWFIQRI